MDDAKHQTSSHEQVGLEVRYPGPELQVIHRECGIEVPNADPEGLHPAQSEEKTAPSPPIGSSAKKAYRRWSTKKLFLLAFVTVVVFAGITVGAVVGTAKQNRSQTTSTPEPSSATPSASPSDSNRGSAKMTGSPTNVYPGLAPTAVSGGYPHLEVYALTNNGTYSIYRKYRRQDATSDSDFEPNGMGMELVGASIDADAIPSIALNNRAAENAPTNRTSIHINSAGRLYRKYHDKDQQWKSSADPDNWDTFPELPVRSPPYEVRYDAETQVMRIFYLAQGNNGNLAAWYYLWRPDLWRDPQQVPGPDLQNMTTPVVAWNGDDSRLDLFAVSSTNSHLLHASYSSDNDSWTDFEDLHGCVTTPPIAVSRNPGLIDLVARGGDGGLWHLAYDHSGSGWADWNQISGSTKIKGQPDVIGSDADSLDVFAWGADGNILHKSFNEVSQKWSPNDGFEILINGSFSGPPKASMLEILRG
ncbi:fucose-specific lectin [Astrocystis sublimbata]|nr:fucose-specific lectin [Astrocystis sublimbata]